MAIKMLCSNNEPGAFERDGAWYKTSHNGLVVGLVEVNNYDDSWFLAEVWTGSEIERVQYATTAAWCGESHAVIDASQEVRAAARAWREARVAEREAAEEARVAKERAARAAVELEVARMRDLKGMRVVLRTKGVEVEGSLFWAGLSGSGKTARVGIRTDAGDAVWGTAKQVRLA